VVATEVAPGGWRVSVRNGSVALKPIVSLNDDLRRPALTAQGGPLGLTHYNGAVQVFPREIGDSRAMWTADVLPDEAAAPVSTMIREGAIAMNTGLARLAKAGARGVRRAFQSCACGFHGMSGHHST
jgi:hypothetical protein